MRFTIGCLGAVLLLSLACSAAQKKGDPAKGKTVFAETCAPCHNADSDARKMGPSLKGLFKKTKLEDGKKVTEENVRWQINTGGKQMPHYQDILTDQEKDDLIAYLKTL